MMRKPPPANGNIPASGTPPEIIPPDADTVFADRAARFHGLARGHALGDWLDFLGHLTRLQHQLLRDHPPAPLPGAAQLARAAEHAMPPLAVAGWPRDPVWRAHLGGLAAGLRELAPAAMIPVLDTLASADAAALEALADAVLRTEYPSDRTASMPLVAAALQIYWTWLAAQPALAGLGKLDTGGVCPCCGSLPVASVVRAGGEVANLRYLHCSLCNTEWNMVRVQCPACEGTERVSYRHIEGGNGAARAECCEACRGYLKIFQQDREPLLDPVADDLATLGLDILVDEAGFERLGPNPLFIPGQPAR